MRPMPEARTCSSCKAPGFFDSKRCTRCKIEALPKWAKHLLLEHEQTIQTLRDDLERLRQVSDLTNHEWTTIPLPTLQDGEESRCLWVLNRDNPSAICSYEKGDVLLVGRRRPVPRVVGST